MVRTVDYSPRGTCSVKMTLQIDDTDDVIQDFQVLGGCDGNLKGIRQLVKGRNAKEVMDALSGIKCGFKNTSCPDQLSKAIAEYYEEKNHD
ncbi:MAG: TIGR03905 family TSCPD domain-containing protein [Eubacteriales bacterium]|nr:TIGR03905 family TSCPD domain-containing protein [Eubacteriales bacterium]